MYFKSRNIKFYQKTYQYNLGKDLNEQLNMRILRHNFMRIIIVDTFLSDIPTATTTTTYPVKSHKMGSGEDQVDVVSPDLTTTWWR